MSSLSILRRIVVKYKILNLCDSTRNVLTVKDGINEILRFIFTCYVNQAQSPLQFLFTFLLFHNFIFLYYKGCCDVVLDQEISSNISEAIAHPGYRKRLNLITGEMSR